MIDYFSGVDTECFAGGGGGGGEGNVMVFCHRRLAVVKFLLKKKGQVKSPILHNTRDGSEFYVPCLSHCI